MNLIKQLLTEASVPAYYVNDEEKWYDYDWDSEVLQLPHKDLKLIGVVLSKGGYRPDAEEAYIYSKNGKIYTEDRLSGDERFNNWERPAFPLKATIFEIPKHLEKIGTIAV